ncbi:aspartate--tRNA ligase dps1 [Gonapodya sp. JEL0774]|nr:aspartate--tRNA ligase dps1 [Gonapodya sp. JEL0774]
MQPTTEPTAAESKEEEVVLGEDGKPLSKKALKKLQQQQEKEAKKQEMAAKLAAEKAAADADDYSKGKYGELPVNQSTSRTGQKRTNIKDLSAAIADEVVHLRARVQTYRGVGAKKGFLVLRQREHTVQAVVSVDANTVSKQMIKFVSSVPAESIVLVEAKVSKVPDLVKSCTVQDVELQISQLFCENKSDGRLPFTLEDATRPLPPGEDEEGEEAEEAPTTEQSAPKVLLVTRLKHRVIDLRTTTNQAIFKIQAGVSKLFREYLDGHGFTEIHSPKIIPAASEGGANVFKVSYFNRDAFLAQSPQFYKQMCICADFERVYEIGPVFRAENSFTHRHMTEFVGLDFEMAFQEHYHEVVDMFEGMFLHIFKGLTTRYATELEVIKRQFPFDDFKAKKLRLHYKDAIALLRENGVTIGDYDDMSTDQEKLLGRLVKAKHDTDFYIIDKFPLAVRPFYTMPDPQQPGYSNSYDVFMRGEEIMSGAQRVHDVNLLRERVKEHGVDVKTIQGYLDAFKYGVPPHAGGGIGGSFQFGLE